MMAVARWTSEGGKKWLQNISRVTRRRFRSDIIVGFATSHGQELYGYGLPDGTPDRGKQ